MEIYSTEEQQVEAIKRWLRENGNYLVAGIVLGLGVVYGHSFYRSHNHGSQEEVGAKFTAVATALEAKGLAAKDEVEAFIADYEGSTQSLLAALQLAKVAADNGAFDVAISQLKLVVDEAKKSDPLASIARLQLARVHLAAGAHDDALAVLADRAFPAEFAPQAAELEGDLQRFKGDRAAAYAAYERALAAAGQQATPLLRAKLNDVADAASAKP